MAIAPAIVDGVNAWKATMAMKGVITTNCIVSKTTNSRASKGVSRGSAVFPTYPVPLRFWYSGMRSVKLTAPPINASNTT